MNMVMPYQNRDLSIHTNHMSATASSTNSSTMPCDNIANARTIAAQLRYLPFSRPRANRPSPSIANESAIEKENSPAIVLFTLPPRIWKLSSKRNTSDASAISSGTG